MQSIRESVHQLLEDQIKRLGLQAEYEIQKAEIKHRYRRTSFTFHGLRDQSVHNIKSLEGADILWVEEAQNVSKKSWRTVAVILQKPAEALEAVHSTSGLLLANLFRREEQDVTFPLVVSFRVKMIDEFG